jgi:hypothetical protein
MEAPLQTLSSDRSVAKWRDLLFQLTPSQCAAELAIIRDWHDVISNLQKIRRDGNVIPEGMTGEQMAEAVARIIWPTGEES